MESPLDRRAFLRSGVAAVAFAPGQLRESAPTNAAPDQFPLQDPALVREMVTVAHGNIDRVRELLRQHPALAEATVDWGFGDWETALGAACHTGRREIAELLLASGAAPTIFSAAMLGQLDLVRAFVSTMPGIQRTYGPHSITLLAHGRAGGEPAVAVRAYLESLGDADTPPPTISQSDEERQRFVGRYAHGENRDQPIDVRVDRGGLVIGRPDGTVRLLRAVRADEFYPVGAESVRVRFVVAGGQARELTVLDPEPILTAVRVSS